MLGLTVLLLPSVGIIAVGIGCLVAETVVALVLLSRPTWWIHNWTPAPAAENLRKWIGALPLIDDGRIFLSATVGLMLVGTITLSIGLTHRNASVIRASLFCTAMALVPLALFYRTGRTGRQPVVAPSKDPAMVWDRIDDSLVPIEGYDELRVDEILPLLQELDGNGLDTVRVHETAREARSSILGRIDLLIESERTAGPRAEVLSFPIPNYDELRVVDILPLLVDLDMEALDAVAAREEAGARRTTVLSRTARLRQRADRAALAAAASHAQNASR
jgi:hypothetical protein